MREIQDALDQRVHLPAQLVMDHLGAAASLEIMLDGAAAGLELLTKLGEEARPRIDGGAGGDLVPQPLGIEKSEVQRWSIRVRVDGDRTLPRRRRESS
jgi:hypothetical protein